MEDLKAYIESGVLELYVLGDLTSAEKAEVEAMLTKYPELRSEMLQVEKALQEYSEANAITPPEELRSRFLNAVAVTDSDNGTLRGDNTALDTTRKDLSFYKYALAASVALLLLSLAATVMLYNQLQNSKSQVALLNQANQKFSNQVNDMEGQLENASRSLKIFQDPEQYKVVNLKGTQKAPSASMIVAFNPVKAEVMVDMASLKLPVNDDQHQYQLWAMVDGKPVDLGVFDSGASTSGMVQMKSVEQPQAFAVTLEPRGGSVSPTMEQMMVMGSM